MSWRGSQADSGAWVAAVTPLSVGGVPVGKDGVEPAN